MPKKEITIEKIILYHMAGDINQWIHQQIDKAYDSLIKSIEDQ